MRQSGNDESIDVSEYAIHRLALLRRHFRKLPFQIAGLNGGEHRQVLDAFEIVGNPVDKFMPEAAKLFLIHVAEVGCEACFGRC